MNKKFADRYDANTSALFKVKKMMISENNEIRMAIYSQTQKDIVRRIVPYGLYPCPYLYKFGDLCKVMNDRFNLLGLEPELAVSENADQFIYRILGNQKSPVTATDSFKGSTGKTLPEVPETRTLVSNTTLLATSLPTLVDDFLNLFHRVVRNSLLLGK